MIRKLFFNFSVTNHPYPEERSSEFELWGEIKLIATNGDESIVILDHQWDILEVIDWFLEKKSALLKEKFPFNCEQEKSIAECQNLLYSIDDFQNENEEENYYAKLDAYFSNHHFKIRGTNTPVFFIGIKGNAGEISWQDTGSDEYKRFLFEMDAFVDVTQKEVEKLLQDWINLHGRSDNGILKRILDLEKEYGESLINYQ